MKSIDEKLINMKYRFLRKAYLMDELKELEARIEREAQTLARLKIVLDKQSGEVEKMEHASITRIFSSLSGHNELRLEKEKADVFRAAFDYRQKQQDLDFLKYQKNLLDQELKQYELLQNDYQALLEIKRKSLECSVLDTIRGLEEQKNRMMEQAKRIKEIRENGKKLRSSFIYILDNLSSLVEDTIDARSLWYPLISQDQIEDVVHEIDRLNDIWEAFDAELQAVDLRLPEESDRSFLLQVSDYIDELDDSRKVRKKVNLSFEQLNVSYSRIREILCILEKKEKEIQYCLNDLDLTIREKIEAS